MIKKKGVEIKSVDEWGEHAGPKEAIHWKKDRSAMESAKAWFTDNVAQTPEEIVFAISGHANFGHFSVTEVEPEALLKFDSFQGPSNMDVLVQAEDEYGKFIIGIEAKADEPFSDYIIDKLSKAMEEKIKTPNSKQLIRIEQLARSLFSKRSSEQPKVATLRYQLLTGLAGTIAEANRLKYDRAIFLIHEFNTPLTSKDKHALNQKDLNAFIYRLSNGEIKEVETGKLYGPISIPGVPLFDEIPDIYISKAKRIVEGSLQ